MPTMPASWPRMASFLAYQFLLCFNELARPFLHLPFEFFVQFTEFLSVHFRTMPMEISFATDVNVVSIFIEGFTGKHSHCTDKLILHDKRYPAKATNRSFFIHPGRADPGHLSHYNDERFFLLAITPSSTAHGMCSCRSSKEGGKPVLA